FIVLTKMKPPSKDAIAKALDILLGSIQEENKSTFTYSCTHPLGAIPFEQLATAVEALDLAKSHLVKAAEDLISRIQHHRNLAAPIHRLPQEIFGMILEKFAANRSVSGEHGLIWLLQVGRIWHDAIVSSPRLWTWWDSALPAKIARLVIERSKGLPILSFIWNTADYSDDSDGSEEHEGYEGILELAIQNSMRFKSMDLRVWSDGPFDIRPLLEGPTPALEALTVIVYRYVGEDGLGEVVLSEGAPLKFVELLNISLNFDSPRLSGLVTLSLSGTAVPNSLDTLLQGLSATQLLEQLTIRGNSGIGEPVAPGPQVTFRHLMELHIEEITKDYCAAFLSSIYAPACSRVYVSDTGWTEGNHPLDPHIWKPGNPQTAALLGLNQERETQVLRISVATRPGVVSIRVHEGEGNAPRFLEFGRPQVSEMVTLLGEFFSDIPFYPPIYLTLLNDILPNDPFDLTPWSARLESLELSSSNACLRTMEQLVRRMVAPIEGETLTSATRAEDWMCPNLQSITFYDMETELERNLDVAALLSLVRTRWSQTDGGPIPANKPAKFVIYCTNPDCESLRDVEIQVQEVVPTFAFRRSR
ncbi:hypothetical protein FRC01_005066, partial [Tulasnella sp. 417]